MPRKLGLVGVKADDVARYIVMVDAGSGQPAEVAPAFVLLVSDEGSYMTGAIIPVTGGLPIF